MFRESNIHDELPERMKGIAGGRNRFDVQIESGERPERRNRQPGACAKSTYHESDHVLNIAYKILSNGKCLEDIELLRNNKAYLDVIGAQQIPDPTTDRSARQEDYLPTPSLESLATCVL